VTGGADAGKDRRIAASLEGTDLTDAPAVPPPAAAPDDLATRPVVTLAPGRSKRAEHGHPWIYSNEVALDAAGKALPPGALVTVATADGRRLGVASFNAHALISLRLFDRDPGRRIDAGFVAGRLARALELRQRLFAEPYYRLIHAEADGLPGLIVDRFGEALVCQLNTAGMARLEPVLLAALERVLSPAVVVLRNDGVGRHLEGLEPETRVAKGELPGLSVVRENGANFVFSLSGLQKTGWFYDQRPNRAFVASLAGEARLLDVYAYTGGFGVLAALRGAADVTLIDRSEAALGFALESAQANGVGERVRIRQGDAFDTLAALAAAKERYDVVVLDPPAFVRTRKDLGAGSRAYRKMVRLGASVTARRGFLFAASCSHNMPLEPFEEAVRLGLADADRSGRILQVGFAGPDHPIHPSLPESAYLKSVTLALD
jgi:23S rRNA (cytosine1962-C5)-methyltransferase